MNRSPREIMVDLAASGLSGEQMALVIELTAAISANAPAAVSKAALRTRRWRDNRASQNVTCDASVTLEKSVTNRHKPSQNVTGDAKNGPLTSSFFSESESGSQKEVSKKEGAQSKKTATALGDDFEPSLDGIKFASDRGVSGSKLRDEVIKFRNYWHNARGRGSIKPRWDLAWQNWVINSIKFNGERNGQGRSGNFSEDRSLVAAGIKLQEHIRNGGANPFDDNGGGASGHTSVRLLSER